MIKLVVIGAARRTGPNKTLEYKKTAAAAAFASLCSPQAFGFPG
jgi:hypothetical protein